MVEPREGSLAELFGGGETPMTPAPTKLNWGEALMGILGTVLTKDPTLLYKMQAYKENAALDEYKRQIAQKTLEKMELDRLAKQYNIGDVLGVREKQEPAPAYRPETGEGMPPYRKGATVPTGEEEYFEKKTGVLGLPLTTAGDVKAIRELEKPPKREVKEVNKRLWEVPEKGQAVPITPEPKEEGIIYPTKAASDASVDIKSIPKGYDLVSKTVIKDGRIVGWTPDFQKTAKEAAEKYDVIQKIGNPHEQAYHVRGEPIPTGWETKSGANVSVNLNLEKSTKGKVEQEMVEKGDALQILRDMEASFKPSYITYPGKARAGTENFFEKWGIMDATKWTADRQMWYQSAKENLLKFRKFITGVAGGEKEYDEIASAAPDPDRNSPTQFMSNVKQSKINTIKLIKRYQMILNLTGVTPTKEQLGSIALSSIKVSPEELGAIEGVKDPLGIRK